MEVGDLIYDKLQKKIGVVLKVFIQAPSLEYAYEVKMAEYIQEDGTISFAEALDVEVISINECR